MHPRHCAPNCRATHWHIWESRGGVQVDEDGFKAVRDALVSKILDIGFLSHLNKVGVVLYGSVRTTSLNFTITINHRRL